MAKKKEYSEYEIEIKASPIFPYYMQHRMDDEKLEQWEKKRGRIIERDDINEEDNKRALFHSYFNDKGKFYIPSEHIRCSMIEAGRLTKGKVGASTRSMTQIVAGMFFIKDEELPIHQKWDIDKRSCVNNNVKARVITIRPKWKDWKTKFTLIVDEPTITKETVKKIVEDAGKYIGIGSYRPQHKGPFGRFVITKFKVKT